ncbi:MAG: hypothetical protein ACLUNO_02115 [Oscillospiraceae bacterium]
MELQLGKQERRMYTRVFDRTEEETCSLDAVVPDALGDLSALVVTEGTFCLWNLDVFGQERTDRGLHCGGCRLCRGKRRAAQLPRGAAGQGAYER